MEATELFDLVKKGEDRRTQFKRNLTNAESLAGDLVAFSNFRGGKILVGVEDDGTVVGLSTDDNRRINPLLSNVATDRVRPSISVTTENIMVGERLVMVVHVPAGISKPYSDSGGVFWTKSGADKRQITSREEIQRLFQLAGLVYADEVPIEGTSVRDIDLDHFREFSKDSTEIHSILPWKETGYPCPICFGILAWNGMAL